MVLMNNFVITSVQRQPSSSGRTTSLRMHRIFRFLIRQSVSFLANRLQNYTFSLNLANYLDKNDYL